MDVTENRRVMVVEKTLLFVVIDSKASIHPGEHLVIYPRMAHADWRRGWPECLKVLDVGWHRIVTLSPALCRHVAGSPSRVRKAERRRRCLRRRCSVHSWTGRGQRETGVLHTVGGGARRRRSAEPPFSAGRPAASGRPRRAAAAGGRQGRPEKPPPPARPDAAVAAFAATPLALEAQPSLVGRLSAGGVRGVLRDPFHLAVEAATLPAGEPASAAARGGRADGNAWTATARPPTWGLSGGSSTRRRRRPWRRPTASTATRRLRSPNW